MKILALALCSGALLLAACSTAVDLPIASPSATATFVVLNGSQIREVLITATAEPSASASLPATQTAGPSATQSPSPAPTASPPPASATATPSATLTDSPTPPDTPTATDTATPTDTPSETPSATLEPTETDTPEDTPVVVPSSTPPPTRTPTATPAGSPPPPNQVTILDNTVVYLDTANYLHIIGEVVNTTAGPVHFVIVTVTFFDGAHQFLARDYTYLYLEHLSASEKTCFRLRLSQPAGWTTYEFDPPTYSGSDQDVPNLALEGETGVYHPDTHRYTLAGQVRNDESGSVSAVQAVGTLYDAAGAPVGCDYDFVDSAALGPGQTSPFSMSFSSRDYVDVAAWRLQVDGVPQ